MVEGLTSSRRLGILVTSSYDNSVLGLPHKLQPLGRAFFAPFCVCRLPLRLGDDPRSTSFGVWLSHFWAGFCNPKSRSRFRHHLLRDVEASSVFLVSGIRRRSTLHFKVHRWKISGSCHRDFDTSILHTSRGSRGMPSDASVQVACRTSYFKTEPSTCSVKFLIASDLSLDGLVCSHDASFGAAGSD